MVRSLISIALLALPAGIYAQSFPFTIQITGNQDHPTFGVVSDPYPIINHDREVVTSFSQSEIFTFDTGASGDWSVSGTTFANYFRVSMRGSASFNGDTFANTLVDIDLRDSGRLESGEDDRIVFNFAGGGTRDVTVTYRTVANLLDFGDMNMDWLGDATFNTFHRRGPLGAPTILEFYDPGQAFRFAQSETPIIPGAILNDGYYQGGPFQTVTRTFTVQDGDWLTFGFGGDFQISGSDNEDREGDVAGQMGLDATLSWHLSNVPDDVIVTSSSGIDYTVDPLTVIPEPSLMAALAGAFALMFVVRRRR